MTILSAIHKLSLTFAKLAIPALVVSCATQVENRGDRLLKLSRSGQCSQADQYANQNFEGSDLYLAKGVVESVCKKNEAKSIEYVTISAKMGNPRAIDALKSRGISVSAVSKPPAPPVEIKERPPVQPVQQVQRVQNNGVPIGSTTCINRGMGVVECSGPSGISRCVNRGMGVVDCN